MLERCFRGFHVRPGGPDVNALHGVRAPRLRTLPLPRGATDAVVQLVVWIGFAVAYEAIRGLAAGSRGEALANAHRVIRLEQHLGGLFELDLQRPVLRDAGLPLLHLVGWTYWLAQFVIVACVGTWLYLRHHHAYTRMRNMLIVANTIGLLGYLFFPLAPPRLLPAYGFVDTLTRTEVLNHRTGLIELFANPYAAMPSLHTADAVILGIAVATVARWTFVRAAALLWPTWVSFALLATGNHFWLDVAAGALLAAGAWWLTRDPSLRRTKRVCLGAVARSGFERCRRSIRVGEPVHDPYSPPSAATRRLGCGAQPSAARLWV